MGNQQNNTQRKASSNSARRTKKSYSDDWQGWINVTPTKAEKEAWEKWHADRKNVDNCHDELVEDGYRYTTKWDDYSQCPQVTIFAQQSDHKDYGWGLSARASSASEALSRALFIHFELLGEDWEPHKHAPRLPDDIW